VVSTPDFESGDAGSNPARTCTFASRLPGCCTSVCEVCQHFGQRDLERVPLFFACTLKMSEAPSWLTEENISTATKVASNPAVQKAAKNPAVQAAAKSAVKAQINKEAPGWTSEDINSDLEQGKKNVPPPPPPQKVASTKTAAPVNTDMSDVDPEVMKQMQKYHLALRVLYMGAAVFLSAAAALALANQQDLGLIFFSFYVFFFSAMICCFECALTVRID
jgi:hypothetical protein